MPLKPVNLKFKGLGSYFDECEIDFSALDSVFLISGETGSGKTTILDALTFALYGESSGGERESLRNSHYTKSDGEAYSVFVFELSGKLYRFSRTYTPKARAEGWDISQNCEHFDKASGEWLPFFDNPRKAEVNAKAQELLGLTAQQFRQVIILPQGKFERLLTCPTKEKEELLSTLFGADRYTEISERLKKNADEEKKAIDTAALEIAAALNADGFRSADEADNTVRELSEKVLIKKKELSAASEKKKKLEKLSRSAAVLADKFSDLDEAEKKLAESTVQKPQFDSLKQRTELLLREKSVLAFTDNYSLALKEYDRRRRESELAKKTLKKAEENKNNAYESEKKHKAGEKENEERREKLIRLKGLEEVYKAAEPLKKETEQALQAGKKLRKERDDAAGRLEELKKALREKNSVCEAAETEAAKALGYLNELKKLEQAAELNRQSEEKEKELKAFSKELDEQEKKLKCAEKKADLCKDEYKSARKAFIDGVSCRLAENLSEGEPCPVCGSTSHPAKSISSGHFSEKEMDAAEKKLKDAENEISRISGRRLYLHDRISETAQTVGALKEKILPHFSKETLEGVKTAYERAAAEQERLPGIRREIKELNSLINGLDRTLTELNNTLTSAREDYSAKNAEYKNITNQMDKDIPDSETLIKKISELSALSEEYDKISAQISENILDAASGLSAAEQAVEKAADEEKTAAQKFSAARESAEKALAGNGLPCADEFVPDKAGIESLPRLQQSCDEFFAELSNRSKSCEKLRSELADKERPDMRAVEKQLDSADKECRTLEYEIRSSEEKADRLKKLSEQCRKQTAALDARRMIYAEQNEFAVLMSGAKGISFTRYVLGVMLDMVTDEANRMLSGMLGGTFRLVRSRDLSGRSKQGLDLMVENTLANNSASYMAAQLSGGEKFLISLVLGVALSAVVQSKFGGISIDAMFIDEGFGSLDPSALSDAVSVIGSISGSRQTVGIISHVEKLREEIPCCISVKKTRMGSSISY